MYTGIIQGLGIVLGIKRLRTQLILRVKPVCKINDFQLGESIAVNGCCLTITKFSELWFETYISPETYSRANFKNLKIQAHVNLERPLKLNDWVGGHIVTGHIDEVVSIKEIQSIGASKMVALTISKINSEYLIDKGSLTLDGISLTITSYDKQHCKVCLIPETLSRTTAVNWRAGYMVNLEIDALAKSANTNSKHNQNLISRSFLLKHGYL
ncbi:MAG: riboflavin synthase [Gammaproteobacteria bacterium]|nr:riboflavin synthase [Gammaproteobacteria bacterium]